MNLTEEISKYIRLNEYVSFKELSTHIKYFKGDLNMVSKKFPNIIFWCNMSQEAIDSIISLLNDGQIMSKQCQAFIYFMDGGGLRLPIVKRTMNYKKPHWLPMVFNPTEKNKATQKEIKESVGEILRKAKEVKQ